MGFGEFYRSLRFVRNFPRSTHIFTCWRARKPGTRMKAQSEISKKDRLILAGGTILRRIFCVTNMGAYIWRGIFPEI